MIVFDVVDASYLFRGSFFCLGLVLFISLCIVGIYIDKRQTKPYFWPKFHCVSLPLVIAILLCGLVIGSIYGYFSYLQGFYRLTLSGQNLQIFFPLNRQPVNIVLSQIKEIRTQLSSSKGDQLAIAIYCVDGKRYESAMMKSHKQLTLKHSLESRLAKRDNQ